MPRKSALPEQGTSADPALNENRWLLAAIVYVAHVSASVFCVD